MRETTIVHPPSRRPAVVVCPSCSMQASAADRRQLRPLAADAVGPDARPGPDLRTCRNCRAVIDVSDGRVQIAEPLASF